jgi:hypothetical protein
MNFTIPISPKYLETQVGSLEFELGCTTYVQVKLSSYSSIQYLYRKSENERDGDQDSTTYTVGSYTKHGSTRSTPAWQVGSDLV